MGARMYCVKERKKVQVSKVKHVTVKERKMITAICPNDGTKMMQFSKD